jgi:UDPglucose 6-dehydrogenase
MKITTIGSGYVGLVTGACMADVGNHVVCFDVSEEKIGILNDGGIPIHEPGLKEIVRRNVEAGRLQFTTDAARAVAHGSFLFICVGTPPDEDGSADLQYVLAAARSIGRHMTDYKIVVDKSTVPVGTASAVRSAIESELSSRGVQLQFDVVSNPEFLKEGAAIEDFMKPERVVVGADSERAALHMRALYAPLTRNHERMIQMDLRSAEFTKYAANAMLATRISFMNELAALAEQVGADIEWVRKGIGSDPRIGYHFLYPGTGYGGSCFPKDVKALVKMGAGNDVPLRILNAVEAANDAQKRVLVDKIVKRLGADLSGRRFALWGLSFKPNTDDMREAPSRVIVADLVARGATVCCYDPVAMKEAQRVLDHLPGVDFARDGHEALDGADALVLVTEWKEFKSPDFQLIKSKLKQPMVFDGRNLYDPALVREYGLEYFGIGRQ